MMWGQFQWLRPVLYFTFVPQWWALIFALDGLLYRLNGGDSIMSKSPKTMLSLAFVSWLGWYLYQYYNHIILHNWYYPNLVFDNPITYHIWHHMGNTTAWAPIFLWYLILSSSEFLRKRYSNGPKIDISKNAQWVLLLIGIILSFGFGYFPYELFWIPWISTVVVMVIVLSSLMIWTPFSEITKGNWSPFILMALATVATSVFWEGWNVRSAPNNPTF